MTEALFDGPGSTTSIKWSDHEGQLVLIWPKVEKPFEYDGETKNVIEARVVVLDPPGGTPIEYGTTVIFPRVMQGQVRGNIGRNRPNLGRVGKGEAKPRQSPPWILVDPNENDKKLAVQFLTGNVTTKSAESTQDSGAPGWSSGNPPF
jgi:hypothetical protein